MSQSESATSVALATEKLLKACQGAVWFQHHCSQNDRSDGLLATELDGLAMITETSANSVQPFVPLLVEAAPLPPEEFFGISDVCHHEVAISILKYLLRDVYVIGDSVGPIPCFLEGKNFEDHKSVSDWSKVRKYMADSPYRINEPGTLNATIEFDRLCSRVRRESILASHLAKGDKGPHSQELELTNNKRTNVKPPKSAGDKPKAKPGRKVLVGKIRLGQALQFDWLTYIEQGNPNDENEVYNDRRIDHGLSGDFSLSLDEARKLRRWFSSTHARRNPTDDVSLEKGFELSGDDTRVIGEWLKGQRNGKK